MLTYIRMVPMMFTSPQLIDTHHEATPMMRQEVFMSLANISIVGNLARDPEQFQFASGRSKTTLTIAVNSFNKIKKEKTTDFYRVETWDRLADLAISYLHKGNQVTVSGRLALEKWIDREGKQRITPTVSANQLAFPPRLKPYPENHDDPQGSHPEMHVVPRAIPREERDAEPPPEFDADSEPQQQPDPEFDLEDGSRHESDVEPPPEPDIVPVEDEVVLMPGTDSRSRKKTA